MSSHITETAVRAAVAVAQAAGKRRELIDHQERGLRLRVSPSGSATWLLAVRDKKGAMRRFTLGRYREFGLAEARVRARKLRPAIKDGADPTADRRLARETAKAKDDSCTLSSLLDLYEKQGRAAEAHPACLRAAFDAAGR